MAKKKVLIVEDNELNMKLFHDLLDAQGYEILETREGLQALALAREHKPDLILMDIQLPEISGLEVKLSAVVHRLRKQPHRRTAGFETRALAGRALLP